MFTPKSTSSKTKFSPTNENEKFITDTYESFSEISEDDENIPREYLDGDKLLNIDDTFEINHFFNELPIRIINNPGMPFIYAEDVCKIFKVTCRRQSMPNFTEKEIVSPELRKQCGINTYKIHRGQRAIDNRKILFTEFGVYRFVFARSGEVADKFRDFVYNVLYQLRTSGEFKIKVELEKLKTINDELTFDNAALQTRLSQFKNLTDELVLIEFPQNPMEVEPSNIPASCLDPSASRIKAKHNGITNPMARMYQMATDLNINPLSLGITEHPIDCNIEDVLKTRESNWRIATDFIRKHSPKSAYMVTTRTSAELLTDGDVRHRVYVKDAKIALFALKNALSDTRPVRARPSAHFYICDAEKIIAAMNAIS